MIDLLFRATSKRALFKLGTTLSFVEGIDGNPPTLTAHRYAEGVKVDLIGKGQYTIKPAEYDADGDLVTPALIDTANVYVNIRLVPPAWLFDKLSDSGDVFDKSKIARWMKNNGVETDVSSLYPGGPARRRFVKNLANGDEIELIWPMPQYRRRIWLGD